MSDVLILTHIDYCPPAHLAEVLRRRGIAHDVLRVDLGELQGYDLQRLKAVAVMGGPMSVNDPLPWIPPVLDFIRGAMDADVPVIGHCLGGQLMSRALGGEVALNPVKEIGWGTVRVAPTAAAREWFGDVTEFLSFHWHGETFTIPPGAERIASSEWCANQTFVAGPHLGMQCHVEMTPAMIASWCESGLDEIAAAGGAASVQTPAAMQERVAQKVRDLNAVARRLYDRWAARLRGA
jgi:GMP synthase-like glutamine amidotransferase